MINAIFLLLAFFCLQSEKSLASNEFAPTASSLPDSSVNTSLALSAKGFFLDKDETLDDCIRMSKRKTSVPFFKNGKFISKCAPDVLYSWQSSEALEKFYLNSAESEHLFKLDGHPLFTWKTPIGSFGYGDRLMRLKLREGAIFTLINSDERNCSILSKRYDIDNTVFVNALESDTDAFSEYILCSDSPIDSWSIDTGQNYDEAMHDLDYVQTHLNTKNLDLMDRYSLDSGTTWVAPWNYALDGAKARWHLEYLENNLREMHDRALKHLGMVFFRQNEIPDIENHYRSSSLTHFTARG